MHRLGVHHEKASQRATILNLDFLVNRSKSGGRGLDGVVAWRNVAEEEISVGPNNSRDFATIGVP
jgi:hypothetical protein